MYIYSGPKSYNSAHLRRVETAGPSESPAEMGDLDKITDYILLFIRYCLTWPIKDSGECGTYGNPLWQFFESCSSGGLLNTEL